MSTRRHLLLACSSLLLAAAPESATPPEPSGYRMQDYRAPTPATLSGATVLTTRDTHAAWQNGTAAFIDVLPRPPRPPGLPAATVWHERPRFDIPNSIWLPDTGYGALAPAMQTYFEDGLRQATAGNHDHPLVFYCLANCWMSWNAAKRAQSLGYTHVAWYRDGTDGWVADGYPTEARNPVPRPPTTE